tara:strand:+ start:199 stop:528 length:330 start_codon:yes stop_codon:yes gene_type:complete
MTDTIIFKRLFVENLMDWDDSKASGYVYLTDGQQKPEADDYLDHFLHIRKVKENDHPSWGGKKYHLYVDRSEYASDNLAELESHLFDWAEGEYHQGSYKIIDQNNASSR